MSGIDQQYPALCSQRCHRFSNGTITEDIEVTGELSVRLWVASDCVDTDFTAKLIDVYPPSDDFPAGFDLNITDGYVALAFETH